MTSIEITKEQKAYLQKNYSGIVAFKVQPPDEKPCIQIWVKGKGNAYEKEILKYLGK